MRIFRIIEIPQIKVDANMRLMVRNNAPSISPALNTPNIVKETSDPSTSTTKF